MSISESSVSQVKFITNLLKALLDRARVEEDITLSVGVFPMLGFTRGDDGSPIYTPERTTVVRSASLIHLAAIEGDEDLISLLLPVKRLSSQSCATFTPIFLALYYGNRQAAQLFLRSRPNLHGPHLYGPSTVLHAAARNGFRDEITQFIKDYEVDPDCEDVNGATPILYALQQPPNDAFTTICLLLALGADKNKRIQGWGYSDIARSMGHKWLADWFENLCDDHSGDTIIYDDEVEASP
ncbi:Ankyrin repeat and SOCS box 3 [Fusarium albosuccineum]|uniref:Ankyrin repeat and SOCS box 3 n=1 Tax=Fusarium albosuccineum TaxID=1237068 RepID=A0A8H4LIS5_9HYPO|nr:Ankyrin repeat and SOCS box 3 [Fusarium albosuccineum]